MTIINKKLTFSWNNFEKWLNIFTEKHFQKLYLEIYKNKSKMDSILDVENHIWNYKFIPNDDKKEDIYINELVDNLWNHISKYRYKKLNNKTVILERLETINFMESESDNYYIKWLWSYILLTFINEIKSKRYKNITIHMNLTSFWFYNKVLKLFKGEWLIKDYMIVKESLYIEIKI